MNEGLKMMKNFMNVLFMLKFRSVDWITLGSMVEVK